MASCGDPAVSSITQNLEGKNSLVKGLNDELTCAICFDRYKQPKVLPCLHLYCKGCLEDMVERSYTKFTQIIVCPQCQTKHNLPPEGVKGLRTYFMVNNLIELLRVHEAFESELQKVESVLYCESGLDENQPATARCITCSHYLCKNCSTIHQRQKITQDHKLCSLEEITVCDKTEGLKSLTKEQYCEEHKKEMLMLFCKTCKKVICRDCALVKCRRHDYIFVQDIRQEIHASLKSLVGDIKTRQSECQNLISSLAEISVSDTKQFELCEISINKHFQVLLNAIEKRREALLSELHSIHTRKQNQIAAQAKYLRIVENRLSTSITFTEQLLESADDIEVVALSTQTKKTLEEQKAMKLDKNNIEPSHPQAIFEDQLIEKIENYAQIEELLHSTEACQAVSSIPPIYIDREIEVKSKHTPRKAEINTKEFQSNSVPRIAARWPKIGYVLVKTCIDIEVIGAATDLLLFDVKVFNNGVELEVDVEEKNATTFQAIFLPSKEGHCVVTVMYRDSVVKTYEFKIIDHYDMVDFSLSPALSKGSKRKKPAKERERFKNTLY